RSLTVAARFPAGGSTGHSMVTRSKEEFMKITRFYATADGGSQFTEVDIPIEHARQDADGNTLRFSNSYMSPNVLFAELPEGMVQGWHHAPARQIVVVSSGVLEVGTSDNQTRRWRAGEAF